MKINCHTNLDLHFTEQWPDELPCRPMNGDYITSSTGLELQVVRVLFRGKPNTQDPEQRDVSKTVCCVELHLPPHRFENIYAFERWYRERR